jgi:hypothetical protein
MENHSMNRATNFLSSAIVAFAITFTTLPTVAQIPSFDCMGKSTLECLSIRKRAMDTSQNNFEKAKTVSINNRNTLFNSDGFKNLNPLYQEALKLNVGPAQFNLNVIKNRLADVTNVSNAMAEQDRRPKELYFDTWWRSGPMVSHRPNYIAYLAHARVREAYLQGKTPDEIKTVNQVFADVASRENIISQQLVQLPWAGRYFTEQSRIALNPDSIVLFGDGQKRWRATSPLRANLNGSNVFDWSGRPDSECTPKYFYGDPAPDSHKVCIVITQEEIRRDGVKCAAKATCNMPNTSSVYVSYVSQIFASPPSFGYFAGGGSFVCTAPDGCWTLDLRPSERYGYQNFVDTWTRVIE